MKPFSPGDVMNRISRPNTSVSAVDGDAHIEGANAADAESQRIAQWEAQRFAGGGRHQSALDPAFPKGKK
jgi:hypothetical protein